MPGHIVAMGGASERVLRFAISLSEAATPQIAILPTASGEADSAIVAGYERLAGLDARVEHVKLFGAPTAPREQLAAADVVVVSGGNTANMLAVWRVHGIDDELEAAWKRGAILCGWSAGMICWFEAGVTDSFGLELQGMRDGLGFLSGSACPHYDCEDRRRPVYRELVDDGFPSGYAADDDAALHFVGTELREIVTSRPDARAYRVEPGIETPLDARLL